MYRIFLIALMLTLPTTAFAETIKASINGMVCAFCATGIVKTFEKQAAVEEVKVDLDSKLVTVKLKPEQSMDDATLTKLITDTGFSVVGIERVK